MAKLRRREPVGGQPGARALLLERPSESPSRPVMLVSSLGQARAVESLLVTYAKEASSSDAFYAGEAVP